VRKENLNKRPPEPSIMTDSSSITFKKTHFYIVSGIVVALFAVLLLNQADSSSNIERQNPSPIPTETVFVPTQSNDYNWNDDNQGQLDEIRSQNCQLSQELMIQSMDLSRQASDLEFNSQGLDNDQQVQNLRNQSIDLLLKSQRLANDC
jgi:hypothetical protein